MNFTQAIQAHSNWKLRLAAACADATTAAIDTQTLAKDDACELGKWLHGEGKKHAADPEFRALIGAHAAFHRSAAEIARMAAYGKGAEALTFINSRDSGFGKHSLQVVGILMHFRARQGES